MDLGHLLEIPVGLHNLQYWLVRLGGMDNNEKKEVIWRRIEKGGSTSLTASNMPACVNSSAAVSKNSIKPFSVKFFPLQIPCKMISVVFIE